MELELDVAAEIRAQRARIGTLTVEQLTEQASALCGTSPRTMRRRYDGGQKMTLEEVSAFAKVLGTTSGTLFRNAELMAELASAQTRKVSA